MDILVRCANVKVIYHLIKMTPYNHICSVLFITYSEQTLTAWMFGTHNTQQFLHVHNMFTFQDLVQQFCLGSVTEHADNTLWKL